jgi:hypothetical protein
VQLPSVIQPVSAPAADAIPMPATISLSVWFIQQWIDMIETLFSAFENLMCVWFAEHFIVFLSSSVKMTPFYVCLSERSFLFLWILEYSLCVYCSSLSLSLFSRQWCIQLWVSFSISFSIIPQDSELISIISVHVSIYMYSLVVVNKIVLNYMCMLTSTKTHSFEHLDFMDFD